MRIGLPILLLLNLLAGCVFGQAANEPAVSVYSDETDTCKIGVYITDLYDLKLSEQTFTSVFYVWFQHHLAEIKPMEFTEVLNAREMEKSNPDVEHQPVKEGSKDSIYWSAMKVKANLTQPWDVRNFPFDRQHLRIIFEHYLDLEHVVFVPDTAESRIDPGVILEEWKITHFRVFREDKTYSTTFGDPSLPGGKSYYGRVVAEISISHEGTGLFWKLFTGVYVAFVIAVVTFYLSQDYQDSRFGLAVGALFAAVGNKYIVDSLLPATTVFTLVDKIHAVTFASVLIIIILTIISLRYYRSGNEAKSKRIDRVSGAVITTVFLVYNVIAILHAIHEES